MPNRPNIKRQRSGDFVRVDCSTGSSQDWGGLMPDVNCQALCYQSPQCQRWTSDTSVHTLECLLSSRFERRCFFELEQLLQVKSILQQFVYYSDGSHVPDILVLEHPEIYRMAWGGLKSVSLSVRRRHATDNVACSRFWKPADTKESRNHTTLVSVDNTWLPLKEVAEHIVVHGITYTAPFTFDEYWNPYVSQTQRLGVWATEFKEVVTPKDFEECLEVKVRWDKSSFKYIYAESFVVRGVWAWTWDSACAWASLCDVCEELGCPQCHWSYASTSAETEIMKGVSSSLFYIPIIGDSQLGFCGMPAIVCQDINGSSTLCSPALVKNDALSRLTCNSLFALIVYLIFYLNLRVLGPDSS